MLALMARLIYPENGQHGQSQDTKQGLIASGADIDKQQLQARIEARRRDDIVRRREFAYLRKVRQQKGLGLRVSVGPSVFQNSSAYRSVDAALEARASTLKKINAIEADLTESWTSGKSPERRTRPRSDAAMLAPASTAGQGLISTAPPPVRPPTAPVVLTEEELDIDLDFTDVLNATSTATATTGGVVAAPVWEEFTMDALLNQPPILTSESATSPEATLVSTAPMTLTELPPLLDREHPVLREAAIRFAEGDSLATVKALLTVVQDPDADLALAQNCTWALLDVYRGFSDFAAFAALASAYTQRFGCPAPEWYSVSSLVSDANGAQASFSHFVEPRQGASWSAPARLDAMAVARLASVQSAALVQTFHWDNLKSIDGASVAALTAVFTRWAHSAMALRLTGTANLLHVLSMATPLQDKAIDRSWWALRLEVLRVLGDQESYDNVALDYCMTYEVSPPSWNPPQCTWSNVSDKSRPPLSRLQFGDTLAEAADAPVPKRSASRAPAPLDLRGVLVESSAPALDYLWRLSRVGRPMVIDCSRLVRVDFAAARSIRNWLAAQESSDLEVRFENVHRLVMVLFDVVGVTSLATVTVATS